MPSSLDDLYRQLILAEEQGDEQEIEQIERSIVQHLHNTLPGVVR